MPAEVHGKRPVKKTRRRVMAYPPGAAQRTGWLRRTESGLICNPFHAALGGSTGQETSRRQDSAWRSVQSKAGVILCLKRQTMDGILTVCIAVSISKRRPS